MDLNGVIKIPRNNSLKQTGRRNISRPQINHPITIRFKTPKGIYESSNAATTTIDCFGLSLRLTEPIPISVKFITAELSTDNRTVQQTGKIVWTSDDKRVCGIQFDRQSETWNHFLTSELNIPNSKKSSSRRNLDRRKQTKFDKWPNASLDFKGPERRILDRRFPDLIDGFIKGSTFNEVKIKNFLRSKASTYSDDIIKQRRDWISELTEVPLDHIGQFSESSAEFEGKIENPIGIAHIPLGIVGPLLIKGDHAKGTFFVPMATTEGALITSYTLGSYLITRSGGANVALTHDELRVAPMFVFKTLLEARAFTNWISHHYSKIKSLAESTSRHLTLRKIAPIINGRRVTLNFHYGTGDAMGMNMACKGTDNACKFIESSVKPEEYWLRSNFNANKKVAANNFINGYGKTVTADITIPRRTIQSILKTTPEEMERYYTRTLYSASQSMQIGSNGHFANAITAIFIACGQDVASVVNSHAGITTIETTKSGDLYVSAYIPNLLIGTVGGGTGFGTSKECLSIIGCYGTNKSKKFAEIIAASALAGEIGICASVVNGTYVSAHEYFGRNRPDKSDIKSIPTPSHSANTASQRLPI